MNDMAPILLPADRPMTEDERRGFRMALACMTTWGRQISNGAVNLTRRADDVAVPFPEMIRHGGETLVGCARALELTLGQRG